MTRRFNPRIDSVTITDDTQYLTCAQLRCISPMNVQRVLVRNVAALDTGVGDTRIMLGHADMVRKCLRENARREASDLKMQRTEINRRIRRLTIK